MFCKTYLPKVYSLTSFNSMVIRHWARLHKFLSTIAIVSILPIRCWATNHFVDKKAGFIHWSYRITFIRACRFMLHYFNQSSTNCKILYCKFSSTWKRRENEENYLPNSSHFSIAFATPGRKSGMSLYNSPIFSESLSFWTTPFTVTPVSLKMHSSTH